MIISYPLICRYFSVTTAFVFYCDAKHSDILWGSSHVFCFIFAVSLYSFSIVLYDTIKMEQNENISCYSFIILHILDKNLAKTNLF